MSSAPAPTAHLAAEEDHEVDHDNQEISVRDGIGLDLRVLVERFQNILKSVSNCLIEIAKIQKFNILKC